MHASSIYESRRSLLRQVLQPVFAISLAILLIVPLGMAQNDSPVSLETNETLFTVLTVINTCGYDQELSVSDPLRTEIRSEVGKAVADTAGAEAVIAPMCLFYRQHQTSEPAHDLSQYVSLALYMGGPPTFALKMEAADLPPDAAGVAGMAPLLRTFYQKIDLHLIWERHRARYAQLLQTYHDPLAKMTFDTEIYLKMPTSGYLGRQFIVYMDAMGAPGQTNARNYASDYYVVISPTPTPGIKLQQIRHTYLHYLLDPLAIKNGSSFQRFQPLLEAVQRAPMDEAFKNNISLLINECMVRAIEERMTKLPDAEHAKNIEEADKDGYVLMHYFYNALGHFENDPSGLRSAYPYMIGAIDVGKEKKRIANIQFAREAAPELLSPGGRGNEHLLLIAERRLATGDVEAAQKLAQRALDEQEEDSGRAFFILAEVATANRDMDGARKYFEQALEKAHEPKVIAWSHIYLGRIFDLREERFAALDQYRAALDAAGGNLPEAKLAAQKGLERPYEPPVPKQPE